VIGVFVSLQDKPNEWRSFFRDHRVETVIVQNILGYRNAYVTPYRKQEEAALVLQSRPTDVRIYVGLAFDERFYAPYVNADSLNRLFIQDSVVAWQFWNGLADSTRQRITGWYIAHEIHNFVPSDEQRAQLRAYLRRTARSLPPRREILIAPYFVPPTKGGEDLLGAEETGAFFADLIRGTPITGLLLQDGAGAMADPERQCEWSVDAYLRQAAHFAREVERALPPGVKFTTVLEAFGDTTANRLRLQRSITPRGSPVIVYEAQECSTSGLCPRRDQPTIPAPGFETLPSGT
jgi:hypothetical protein